jgi:hypothetical protein
MKNLRIGLLLISLMLTRLVAFADEGMWLPQLLQSLNEKNMKKLGMKISASDIYNINKSSLKDAIVSLGGFCTAEVISEQGLLLTNHHCGFDAIQSHSSLQNNYIRDGFWAKTHGEELRNPGLFATFIIRIEEVTDAVLKNVIPTMTERDRQSAIDKNIAALRPTIKKETYQDIVIRPFFEGNRYYMFITETYKDVRLVGAPPSAIGNFGKDTDNWMWPRHTGDFTMFRIYAGKDNKPADYSPENVPYKPKKSLTISLAGMKQGDFTMVFGFPGRTSEYLHSAAVEQLVNVTDPAKIAIRAEALRIIGAQMRKDEQVKIQYAAKYAGIENYHKKWKGEVLGLKTKQAVAKKKAFEAEFAKRVSGNPKWSQEYGTLLADVERVYKEISPYTFARDYYNETNSIIELIQISNTLNELAAKVRNNGQGAFDASKAESLEEVRTFFRDYNLAIDRELFATLIAKYIKDQQQGNVSPLLQDLLRQNNNDYNKLAEQVYRESRLTSLQSVELLLNMNAQQFSETVQNDVGTKILLDMRRTYTTAISPRLSELQPKLNQLQRQYMKAQIEMFPERTFYPDANSTLRVSYGKVNGYRPRDAVDYGHYTYLDGVMDKYVPGDYEFDVPQKLIDLYKKKDYGRYGENGKMPVCFIGTNHTTGGNSGSPALDANGYLVGLNFDRVFEGTMSDVNYDPDICRNIMVDIRYVLFVVDKFAGATNLINEMKIVNQRSR